MEPVLADAAIKVAPAIILMGAGLALRRSGDIALIALVAMLYVADYTLLNITEWLHGAHLSSSHWNWEGKFASILLGLCALAVAPRAIYEQAGLFRLPDRSRWPIILVTLAAYLGVRGWLLSVNGGEAFHAESALYQATMPGLDEELWYRGILWGLLAATLDPGRIEQGRMPWLTLAVTSFWFGWVHAASATLSSVSINWDAFIWPAISGLVFGLLQGLGRSLWLPMAAHNAGNTMSWLGLFR